jgi:hypothetical protein
MPRFSPFGFVRAEKNIYVPIPAGTGAVEVVTDWSPGFAFTIESVKAYVATAGVGAGASRVFRVLKGASTVVATRTMVLANTDTVGKEVAFTVTAANASYGDADVLTVDFPAAGAVAYTAGAVNLTITYRVAPQKAG